MGGRYVFDHHLILRPILLVYEELVYLNIIS